MIRALLDFYEYLLDTGLVEEQFGWAEMAVPMTLDVDSEGKVLSLKSNVYTEKNEKGKEQQIVPRMLITLYGRTTSWPVFLRIRRNTCWASAHAETRHSLP